MIRDEKMRPVVLLAAVTALCLVGDSMLYVALPVHWEEFGLTSLWQAGVLLSVNRLVRLPLNPAVSRLYRRISARSSARSGMLLAAALAAATTAGYGLAGSFAALIVLRALWGLAWTFLRLGAYFTVLTTADDSSQGRAMGMYNGLMRTGSLFGMLLGGVLADTWGTGLTCAFFASVSVLAVPLIWFAVPRNAKGMAEEAYSLFSHWKVLSVLLIGTAVAFVYQGMLISTLSYLVKIRIPAGLDLGWALVGAASLGGVLQAVRWSWEPFLAPFSPGGAEEDFHRFLPDRRGALCFPSGRYGPAAVAPAAPPAAGDGDGAHHGRRRGGGRYGGAVRREDQSHHRLLRTHRRGRGGGTGGGVRAESVQQSLGVVPAGVAPSPPRRGGLFLRFPERLSFLLAKWRKMAYTLIS